MKKLTLVLIIMATVVSGCKKSHASESLGDTAAPRDPKAAVIEASRKLTALKSLSGKVEAVAETPYKKDVEYVAPDRYHVMYRDDAGAQSEMIMGGNDAFVKDGDSWKEIPGDTNPSPTMLNSFTEEALKSVSDVKSEADESINGVPAYVYSYNLVTVIGNFPVKQKIWVSKNSGLPVKCFVEYSNGPIKTLTTTFDTQTPVTINLPPKS